MMRAILFEIFVDRKVFQTQYIGYREDRFDDIMVKAKGDIRRVRYIRNIHGVWTYFSTQAREGDITLSADKPDWAEAALEIMNDTSPEKSSRFLQEKVSL